MNYKKLRDDTLKIVFREVYNRYYIGLEYDTPALEITHYIDTKITNIMGLCNKRPDEMTFSTPLRQLEHPVLSINDYGKLYNAYRFLAMKYKDPFARNMRTMLAITITNKMIDAKMLGKITMNDYEGGIYEKGNDISTNEGKKSKQFSKQYYNNNINGNNNIFNK